MIVIDSSALLDGILTAQYRAAFQQLHKGNTLLAPSLIDLECLQVLRRFEYRKLITKQQAEFLSDFVCKLPIDKVPFDGLLANAWKMRMNFTPL